MSNYPTHTEQARRALEVMQTRLSDCADALGAILAGNPEPWHLNTLSENLTGDAYGLSFNGFGEVRCPSCSAIDWTLGQGDKRFVIDTPEKADWLLRKLAAIDTEKATMATMVAQRIGELDADRNALLSRFGAELEAWARQEAEARRRKTVTLLHGAISFRTVPSKLVVQSEADAITTARAVAPETVTQETTERFDKAGFLAFAKAHLESTGELLPGLTRTEEKESFSIKF